MRASPRSISARGTTDDDRRSQQVVGGELPVLSLRDICAGYGSFQALFDVSLDVAAGEAIGVVGSNGAGKSTLMRVISGMLRTSSGELAFDGRSLTRQPAHRILAAGIAHVPENRRLFARLTVEENLRIGSFIPAARQHYAERRDWVFSLFPRLLERRRQLAGTLSGGEQQMVAIGRALMSKPKMLLMDEPSAGLAPLVVEQVFALVRRIREEGFTVLIVEQNVQQVLGVVDRAYLLEVGRIRLSGSAAELMNNALIRQAYMGL
jgi:branched-chain amino acid transport system ATP-binding protein